MTDERARLGADARQRVDTYLDAIDRALASAGVPRDERVSIADDVEAQVLEMLAAAGVTEPSAADVEAVLAKLDPPEAYAQESAAPPPPAPPAPPVRPHLSRAALVGALWGATFLVPLAALVMPYFGLVSAHDARREAEMAAAQAARLQAESDAHGTTADPLGEGPAEEGTLPSAAVSAPSDSGPSETRVKAAGVAGVIVVVLLIPLFLLGFTAPLGTTVLGIVAIYHIRRAAGRLYGLGLALADALVFPLLLLDALMLAPCAVLAARRVGGGGAALVVALVLVVVADGVVFWLVRRATARRAPRATAAATVCRAP